ncbi:DUF3106 domain-containing protein [Massilia endophytica]|uniref:DUF3106 domain-containing protein n=1 Tax=Massilia endophytica TaxID=2899220 RepID=UPI001E444879|nr:DUF3106 domain-containing protein [Massilia endophytica]UGQ44796.1 DUF3106 domain-containing protein [Massilia endophytica]
MAQVRGRTPLVAGIAVLAVLLAAGAVWLHHESGEAPLAAIASVPAKVGLGSNVTAEKPRWSELNAAQQKALGPLESTWDELGPVRKKKWLDIANRFNTMKPDEQQRVHERMREWTRLSPDERKAVRENYARAQKIVGGQKAAQWEQYQQLPEEEKRKLADTAAGKRQQVAKPPTPAQSMIKTPQPIKAHGQGLVPPPGTPAPVAPTPAAPAPATPAPAPVVPAPAAPVTSPAPAPEVVYPLEGAATPAAMNQQSISTPASPAPAPNATK